MRGILDVGQAITVSASKSVVERAIGRSPLRISEVPQTLSLGEVDDQYLGWLGDYVQTLTLLPTELNLQVHDPRWAEVFGVADQAAGVAALTRRQLRDTHHSLYWFRSGQDDLITFRYEMPHEWDRNIVEAHLQVMPGSPAGGNVVFSGEYAWTRASSSLRIPTHDGWTPFSVTTPLSTEQQWGELPITFATITPPEAAKGLGATLWICLRREGTNPADTYTTQSDGSLANVGLVSTGLHYRTCCWGSTMLVANPT